MQVENKLNRQNQIEQAAYAVLREKGYTGTSMLSIAKRARASNETLYRWYGDKLGLFRSLIERNAKVVKNLLETQITSGAQPLDTLRALGPELLSLLTSERAIGLNQAAAADQTGELGAALSEMGRETIAPLISQTLEKARADGVLAFDDTDETTDLYLSLLVGDLQIRRAIGRISEPRSEFIKKRAQSSYSHFITLVGA